MECVCRRALGIASFYLTRSIPTLLPPPPFSPPPKKTRALAGDDFEKNYCKHNRGSAWLFLVKVGPTAKNVHNPDEVFVVAMGMKGGDHTSVLRLWIADLQRLARGVSFFAPCLKRAFGIRAFPYVWSADNPEKNDIKGTASCVFWGG